MDLDLHGWLNATETKRKKLLEYSKSPISTDPGERQLDVSRALELGQEAGDLLADAEQFLAQDFARAVLEARKDHDAATARISAKGATAGLQRLRDGLSVVYQTIKDRRYTLLSVGRW